MEPWEIDLAIDVAIAEARVKSTAPSPMLVADARNAVAENDITKFDFVRFRGLLTRMGYSNDEAQQAWAELRARDLIGDGSVKVAVDENDEQKEDEDVEVGELVLITTTGCPGCEDAKEVLSEWIPDVIEVLNVQESDRGLDLVMENELPMEAPMLLNVTGDKAVRIEDAF